MSVDEKQKKTQMREPTALEVAVKIHAAKVVKKAVQGFMDGVEFEESISEDYKAGFYEFGHAVIKVLEDMEGEDHAE